MAAEYRKLLESPIWALYRKECQEKQAKLLGDAVDGDSTNKRMKCLDAAKGIEHALQVPILYRAELSTICIAVYGRSLEEVEQQAAEYTGAAVKEAAQYMSEEEEEG